MSHDDVIANASHDAEIENTPAAARKINEGAPPDGQPRLELTDIPTALIVARIFPYLKTRSEWINFSLANTEIRDGLVSHDELCAPWPENHELRVPGPNGYVQSRLTDAVWSPDGRQIACIGCTLPPNWDSRPRSILALCHLRIFIFDQCKGFIKEWVAHYGSDITSICFSPDGHFLASCKGDGEIKVWDCRNDYECIHSWDVLIDISRFRKQLVLFSLDSKFLAVVTEDKASLLRIDNGSLAKSVAHGLEFVSDAVFCPDGRSLILAGKFESDEYSTCVIKRWWIDKAGGDLFSVIATGPDTVLRGLSLSPDGSTLTSADGDGNIKLWQLTDVGLEHVRTVQANMNFGHYDALSFSPDGKYVVVRDREQIRFLKLQDGTVAARYPNSEEFRTTRQLKHSPDGSFLLVATSKKLFLVLNSVQDDSRGSRKGSLED